MTKLGVEQSFFDIRHSLFRVHETQGLTTHKTDAHTQA